MHYVLFYDFVENIVERRTPHREEHLRLARAAHERGELLMAGAFADPVDSSALVFRADSPSPVEQFARQDPYVINGLVTRWRVRPWNVAIGG
jgi:uncharacterized protein YciI